MPDTQSHRQSIEPMQAGKFEPTWESLSQYQTPAWFGRAKFGIWAHWGPQCQPEQGDWYARLMYSQHHPKYDAHIEQYDHPSRFGFKDVIHAWKAERWDPEELVALYKRAGAQYFFAMANHHDNLDLWDSAYQPWNTVTVGPKRDIIAEWAEASRKHGLRFGVSVHAARTWLWYETAQDADSDGPLAGVPYDGKLTKADGRDTWWEGLDPQDLYEQNHPVAPDFQYLGKISGRWDWVDDASVPDEAYCRKFYNRTVDLINKYDPDLIYFDDTALPLWPISDVGLKIAAHYYNRDMLRNEGKLDVVLFGKAPDEMQRQCMVWDIERGVSNRIESQPFQSETCIGSWHYERAVYEKDKYKSAATVIHMLADIVSKNGNLLLSVPLRGDGTIDEKERAIVEAIADWMAVNREAIFGTKPWKVFGEGPACEVVVPIEGQGFNEGKGKPFTAKDVRFTTKGDVIYAITLGLPREKIHITSMGTDAGLLESPLRNVRLLGSDEKLNWSQTATDLTIEPPTQFPAQQAAVFVVEPAGIRG